MQENTTSPDAWPARKGIAVRILTPRRLLFALLVVGILCFNIFGFTKSHQPSFDRLMLVLAGHQPTVIDDAIVPKIGWPLGFATFWEESGTRPGFLMLLGFDAGIHQVWTGMLVVNLVFIALLVICLSLVLLGRPKPANRLHGSMILMLFSLSAVSLFTYRAIDARDSSFVGQAIQLRDLFSDDPTLPEVDDFHFNDYTSFSFAKSRWINFVGIVIFVGFESTCYALIGYLLLRRFRRFGLVPVGLLFVTSLIAFLFFLDVISSIPPV